MMTRHAACSCGQLRLEIEGEPSRVSMCHCLECQRRTGAVISNQARFHREQITFAGQATAWSRKAESGNALTFYFCPTCGSTVYWEGKGFHGYVAVAIGNSLIQDSQRRPLRCGRSHATPGSHCHPTLQRIAWQSRAEIRTSISGPGHWRRFGPILTQHAMLANVGVGSFATDLLPSACPDWLEAEACRRIGRRAGKTAAARR